MALLDDIGSAPVSSPPTAAAPTSSLLSDIGGTPAPAPDRQVSAHPVTDELTQIGSNIVKQLPRNLIQGAGALADLPGNIWDMAFHPEDEPHPMAHLVAEKLADRMEKSVPQLKPVNQGSIERTVGAGFEALPQAALGGPEAIIPTMMSGAASQGAKEAGFGPVGQTIAGLTPFAPSAAAGATRALLRGGEEGAAATAENVANAKNAGINISAGQATDSTALQTAEAISGRIPGGAPIQTTRGAGLNSQAEESVNNIVKKLAPDVNQKPPTPTSAGESVQAGVKQKVQSLKDETSEAKEAMDGVIPKETPFAAPKLEAAAAQVTGPTGVADVDNLVTGAKTKKIAGTVNAVADSNKPRVPTSYSTDGEGAHVVTSPNGETHAVETAQGDLKVTRSDTSPAAQGQGEGTSRLETLAHTATSQGKNLVSDISVSPAESAAYEKLGRRGWTVEKNPNAEVNPATGNTISDSPKNPVYTVKAPQTQGSGAPAPAPTGTEKQFTGEWSYDPKTGQSVPGTSTPQTGVGPTKEGQSAVLDQATPHTFDSLRTLRTNIGRAIKTTADPGQRAQLSQLYSAASDDLQAGVSKLGPQAEQSYGFFNSVAKQNAETQKVLVKAVTKAGGPEAVFKAAVNGSKDGASKISPIMGAMDEGGRNLFRATVLHRLGRAGGAADAPFDANLFLTNWKGMSPEAKTTMFGSNAGPQTGQLRTSLDSLSKTLDLLKSQGYLKSQLANSVQSGVSGALGHSGFGAMLALVGERVISAGGHIMSGNPIAAAATLGSGAAVLAANPVLSRVLTNPKTAAWLAQATRAPKSTLPILATQLSRMGNTDPDAKDLAALISQSRGSGGSTQASNAAPAPPPPQGTGVRETVYPKINRSAGMQPLPGGGYGIPPETM